MLRMIRDGDGDGDGDNTIFIVMIGAVVVAILGYAAYKLYMSTQNRGMELLEPPIQIEEPVQSPPPTSIDTFADNVGKNYYQETAPVVKATDDFNQYIVENDETVTWTDWMGRERNVTISRKVR